MIDQVIKCVKASILKLLGQNPPASPAAHSQDPANACPPARPAMPALQLPSGTNTVASIDSLPSPEIAGAATGPIKVSITQGEWAQEYQIPIPEGETVAQIDLALDITCGDPQEDSISTEFTDELCHAWDAPADMDVPCLITSNTSHSDEILSFST